MNKQLNIGWAQTDITPDRPIYLIGQLFTRISSYVHDPITATCLVLENGEHQMTFVSFDSAGALVAHMPAILDRVDIPELDKTRVMFNATHTHTSSAFAKENTSEVYFKSVLGDICPEMEEPENILKDNELTEFFVERIAALITDAWESRAPGGISAAHDYAAIGFNRRPQFLINGKRESKMYGTCSDKTFLGYEGGVDHSADMLYTWDLNGNLTGAAVCIPCPAQVCELHDFISADYWHEARNAIREELGNIFILPWCGAAGDQCPVDLTRFSKDNEKELKIWNAQETAVWRNFDMLQECKDIGDRICDAVCRGYRKAKNRIETRPVFMATSFRLNVPLRTVSKEDVDAAQARIDAVKAQYAPGEKMSEPEMIRCFEDIGYINRWKRQQISDRFESMCFVFRIGHAVLASAPFELYVDYSLRMKARCKARQAFVIQLSGSEASGGYLPTQIAVDGGSYGSKPVSTMVGPEGGDEFVEQALAVMDSLFECG